jgi:hypothetical protein
VVAVNYGGSQNFTIAPNAGHQIADVKVDGVSVGAVTSFLFGAMTSNHTIEAAFSSLNDLPENAVLALNAGGRGYTSRTGVTYSADKYYEGGSQGKQSWRYKASIAGTDDDVLYESERLGDFGYAIPISNGDYVVTLKFAEIYWSSANRRIFSVKIAGKEVISNLDIFAKAGKNRAYDVALPVNINDGVLRIEFVSIKDRAKVNAIFIQRAR